MKTKTGNHAIMNTSAQINIHHNQPTDVPESFTQQMFITERFYCAGKTNYSSLKYSNSYNLEQIFLQIV